VGVGTSTFDLDGFLIKNLMWQNGDRRRSRFGLPEV
jgi:hypothetical protein